MGERIAVILLNLMSLQSRGPMWVFMTIVLVAGGAWLVHEASRSFLCGLLALVIVGVSLVTAVRNIGGLRKAGVELRDNANEAKNKVAARRAGLEAQRKAQADMPGVGETSPDIFKGQIEKEKFNQAWKSSKECTDATAWASTALCNRIADLKVKLSAAEARDNFQRQIDEIDNAPAQATAVPLPTADNGAVIRAVGWLGIHPTSDDVDQTYEMILVLAYELLAAVMPSIAFRRILTSPSASQQRTEADSEREPVAAKVARAANKAKAAIAGEPDKVKEAATLKANPKPDAASVAAFIAANIVKTDSRLTRIECKALRQRYEADCRAKGVTPVTHNGTWGKLAKAAGLVIDEEKSATSKRIDYIGVAFAAPHLRLVSEVHPSVNGQNAVRDAA